MKNSKKTPAVKPAKARKEYTGPAIQVSKLFSKDMSQQFKGKDAVAYAAVQEPTQTIQYFNLYSGRLTPGYRAEFYTFAIKPKALKKLEEGWTELEPSDWPSVVTPVSPRSPAKRSRVRK